MQVHPGQNVTIIAGKVYAWHPTCLTNVFEQYVDISICCFK